MNIIRRFRATHLLAARLGITQGQASTLLVGCALAAALTFGGLPPVLRRGPLAPGSLLAAPSAAAATPDSSVAPVAAPVGDVGTTPEVPSLQPLPTSAPSFGSPPPAADPGVVTVDAATPVTENVIGSQRLAKLDGADGIAADNDRIVVASNQAGSPSKVLVLAADGSTTDTFTVAGQPENRTAGVTGLAIDGDAAIAADAATGRILRFNRAGAQSTVTELPDLPACQLVVAANAGCEPGIRDDRPAPAGVAIGPAGALFVTDPAQGVIWRIRAGDKPEVLTNDFRFAGGKGLRGIVAAADGSLLVTAPEAVDPEAAAGGAVYRISSTGTPTLVVRFPRGDSPAGLALLGDEFVVALQGASVLVRIGPDGVERERLNAPEVDLAAPVDVTVRAGRLLVTDVRGVVALAASM